MYASVNKVYGRSEFRNNKLVEFIHQRALGLGFCVDRSDVAKERVQIVPTGRLLNLFPFLRVAILVALRDLADDVGLNDVDGQKVKPTIVENRKDTKRGLPVRR